MFEITLILGIIIIKKIKHNKEMCESAMLFMHMTQTVHKSHWINQRLKLIEKQMLAH